MITTKTITQKSNMPIALKGLTKDTLLTYFQDSWALYDCLFSAIIEEESFYLSPDPLRNPLVFYLGHTAAFYINKLQLAGLIATGINPTFEVLFAKGVDPNLPENLAIHELWPSIAAVRDYRLAVKQTVERCIEAQNCPASIDETHPLWALLMAIEHDRIHFETSSVLIRQVDEKRLKRPQNWTYAPSLNNCPENKIIQVSAGKVSIGKAQHHNIYGWDNEYGILEQNVAAFEASQNLISNQEYLVFYNSGAYHDAQFWTKEGWEWKNRNAIDHPKFWVKTTEGFKYRAMFDLLPMPLDFPVEVNAHEAWAYCQWKGEGWRLLSESEFHLIAHNDIRPKDAAFETCYNLNMKYGSPSPVGFCKEGQSSLGFNDLFGNVWDWLSNDFYALPNFEAHPWYGDFSAPYFDSEHSMLLGGAWATTGTATSKYYRLWFRRHFYQHAGFRIAKNL